MTADRSSTDSTTPSGSARLDRIERRVSMRWPLVTSVGALALVAALTVLVGIRANVDEVDADWMHEILEHRSPLWLGPALVMNFVGAGWFAIALPIAIALVFVARHRPWSALYVALASGVSAAIVQILKVVVNRERPSFQVIQLDSASFPSGHSANAATLATLLFILFPRVWVWIVGLVYTLTMMLSRTYLGEHWLTDTFGGLLLGLAIAILVWAPLSARLRRERPGRTR